MQGLDSMVAACLNKDANQRPTAAELLKDPVLKHGHDHKWLAKRLAALERDRSSRRVQFKDGSSTAHSGSHSPNSTPPVSFGPFWSHPVPPLRPITSDRTTRLRQGARAAGAAAPTAAAKCLHMPPASWHPHVACDVLGGVASRPHAQAGT